MIFGTFSRIFTVRREVFLHFISLSTGTYCHSTLWNWNFSTFGQDLDCHIWYCWVWSGLRRDCRHWGEITTGTRNQCQKMTQWHLPAANGRDFPTVVDEFCLPVKIVTPSLSFCCFTEPSNLSTRTQGFCKFAHSARGPGEWISLENVCLRVWILPWKFQVASFWALQHQNGQPRHWPCVLNIVSQYHIYPFHIKIPPQHVSAQRRWCRHARCNYLRPGMFMHTYPFWTWQHSGTYSTTISVDNIWFYDAKSTPLSVRETATRLVLPPLHWSASNLVSWHYFSCTDELKEIALFVWGRNRGRNLHFLHQSQIAAPNR